MVGSDCAIHAVVFDVFLTSQAIDMEITLRGHAHVVARVVCITFCRSPLYNKSVNSGCFYH